MHVFRKARQDQGSPAALLAVMIRKVTFIGKELASIMAAQDDINAATAAVTALLTDLQSQVSTLGSDLTALQALIQAGQPVSTTALDAAVAQVQGVQQALDTAVTSITQLARPPAPPAP